MLQKDPFSYDKSKFKVYIMSIIPYIAETYSSFRNTRHLRAFLLVPGWDVSLSQGYLPTPPLAVRLWRVFTYTLGC